MSRKASIFLFITAIALLLYASFAQPGEAEENTMTESHALEGTHWSVEDISSQGVVDRSHTTIHFLPENRVAGDSSCNRYMGGFEIDGQALKFLPLAGTMRACLEALMNQERAFYDAMANVTAWEIDAEKDLLYLKNAAGETIIRAFRSEAED